MSNQKVSGSNGEDDDVLYEFSTLQKWSSNVLTPNPLRYGNLQHTLPPHLIARIENVTIWKIAVSPELFVVALLAVGGELELRRLDVGTDLVAKSKLLSDPNPDWCHLQWTRSNNLLILSRSTAVLDVFEPNASYCYSIPLEGNMNVQFNPYTAVSAIASSQRLTESKWSDKLLVLQYNGTLRSYMLGRLCGYHPLSRFNLSAEMSSQMFCSACYLNKHDLLLIGAQGEPEKDDERVTAGQLGLSLWRTTDTDASYLRVPNVNLDQRKPAKTFLDWLPFVASKKAHVVCLSANRSETLLSCVTSVGDLGVFRLPSMQRLTYVPGRMFKSDPNNDMSQAPLHVRWWSDQELILLRVDGTLSICKVTDCLDGISIVQKAPSEKFCYWSALAASTDGLCHVFEAFAGENEEKVESGSKIWLAVRMAVVWLYGWAKLGVVAALGNPASEVQVPSPDAVGTKKVEFRLHELRRTTPLEMFRKKLDAELYSEALALAKIYEIDTDLVYERQWNQSPITEDTITNCLGNVKNKEWALKQCLERVSPFVPVTKALLHFGLSLTQLKSQDLDVARLTNEERCLCEARLKLEHYHDVLSDYQAMLDADKTIDFDIRYYMELREKSTLDIALHLAQSCKFKFLEKYLRTHSSVLCSHWLTILSQIPEVVDVAEYKHLLPKLENGSVELLFACEQQQSRSSFSLDSDLSGAFEQQIELYRTGSDVFERHPTYLLFRFEHGEHFPSETVYRWFEMRALEIENWTTLPEFFVHFLNAGVEIGFADLIDLRDDAAMYSELMFHTDNSDHSFPQFRASDVLTVCKALVNVKSEIQIMRLEQVAVPYIVHSERFGRCQTKTTFLDLLLHYSLTNLNVLRQLLDKWRRRSGTRQQLGMSDCDLVDLVQGCLKATEAVGDRLTAPMAKLLNYLPQAEEVTDEKLRLHLERLSASLEALVTLDYYDMKLRFERLSAAMADKTEAAALLNQLVHRAKPEQWGVNDWQRLYTDCCTLATRVLAHVELSAVQELFVDGLLNSADEKTIEYAAEYMAFDESGPLPLNKSARLVLKAAANYVNGARDSSDPQIRFAKLCLDLMRDYQTDEIRSEINIIAALPILEELGLRELPTKVRLTPNKVELIERVVDVPGQKNYRKLKKLHELADLLRICESAQDRKGRVLHLCAKKALQLQDGVCAGDFCSQLVALRYSLGGQVCRDVAQSGLVTDLSLVLELTGFALLNCEQSEIESLLDWERRAKINLICNNVFKEKQPNLKRIIDGLTSQIAARTRSNTIPLDAIYCAPEEYRASVAEHSNLRYATAGLLRLLCLNRVEQEQVWRETHKICASVAAGESATVALAHLMALNEAHKCIGHDHDLLSYLYALLLTRKMDWANVCNVPPTELVDFVRRHINDWDEPQLVKAMQLHINANELSQQLDAVKQHFPEVDVERYAVDEQYREDSILGMAETANDDQFAVALSLAREHDIDAARLKMASLSHLLSDYELSVSVAQSIIRRRKLLDSLSQEPDLLYGELHRSVLPLLDGRDHNKLMLYFLIVEKGCVGLPEAIEAQMHRSVLRHLSKLLPDIDYRKLISNESDLYDVLSNCLTSKNVDAVSSVIEKVPNKAYTSGNMKCVFAKRIFDERLLETGHESAFRAARSVLETENIDANSFMAFVEQLLKPRKQGSFDTNDLLPLLIEYAQSHERLSVCIPKLEASLRTTPSVVSSSAKSTGQRSDTVDVPTSRDSQPSARTPMSSSSINSDQSSPYQATNGSGAPEFSSSQSTDAVVRRRR